MSLTAAVACVIVLCDDHAQESGMGAAGHGRAALSPRRAGSRLAAGGRAAARRAGRTAPASLLPAAAVLFDQRAGKEGCRCTRGEPHGPYVYLQVAGHLVYVPSALAEAVRGQVETSRRLRGMLEEISAINLELLARRELD